MSIFYPNRRTVVISAVCLVAVAGTSWYVNRSSASEAKKAAVASVLAPTPAIDPSLAVNSDWQTSFFDATGASKTASKTKPAPAEQLTATDRFGRAFLNTYMQMQQAGLDSDPATVNSAVNKLVADSMSGLDAPQAYTSADIHVTGKTDNAALQEYGSRVLLILHSYVPDENNNEAVIAQKALDSGDMTKLSQIDQIITNYQAGISALKTVTVPSAVASYHLSLMNGMSIALFNAKAFRKADVDPVRAMGALSLEVKGLQTMNDALIGIKSYVESMGVPFKT